MCAAFSFNGAARDHARKRPNLKPQVSDAAAHAVEGIGQLAELGVGVEFCNRTVVWAAEKQP